MTDEKKSDPLTMLYAADPKDDQYGDFEITRGEAQGLKWITTTDISAAKKAGWKPLASAQKAK